MTSIDIATVANFRTMFPKLDKALTASFIKEVFQTSKRDASAIISSETGWLEFFQQLEQDLATNETVIQEKIRQKFSEPHIKDDIKELAQILSKQRVAEKKQHDRLKALELCKEMILDLKKGTGRTGESPADMVSMKEMEDFISEQSINSFTEWREEMFRKKRIQDEEECLENLLKDDRVVVILPGGDRVSPSGIELDKASGKVFIIMNKNDVSPMSRMLHNL